MLKKCLESKDEEFTSPTMVGYKLYRIMDIPHRYLMQLYGGYGEMAQKVIEGDISHVKSYAWEIEMAQFENGSESRSRVFLLIWLNFSVEK